LRRSRLYSTLPFEWWFYTVQLSAHWTQRGTYPDNLPMPPRILLSRCSLEGQECLDIGTMEGLIPVLMRRGGADRILAVDALDHCVGKLAAVKRAYGVDFEYRSVGLMYELDRKLPGEAFDVVNLSGLLYHVLSPPLVLCGVRPLMKRNGVLIVSTIVVDDDGFFMEFNANGRLQEEPNTFWYVSVPLFDYLLRYLRLAPIDCAYLSHADVDGMDPPLDRPTGYLAVACRAVDTPLPTSNDAWMPFSAHASWEHLNLCDWSRAERQEESSAGYAARVDSSLLRSEIRTVDLLAAVRSEGSWGSARSLEESHHLRLGDER
jgi:SAM-dependent methyltransferase